MTQNKLTHIDDRGNARMVNVGHKNIQMRTAKAVGHISLTNSALQQVKQNLIKKGDVLTTAEIAGIQAAKQTSSLIPLCHNIVLSQVLVQTKIDDTGVNVQSEVQCIGQTGAEMEALTAVSVALLTIYDMCKSVDKEMVIGPVQLIEKSKSDLED